MAGNGHHDATKTNYLKFKLLLVAAICEVLGDSTIITRGRSIKPELESLADQPVSISRPS